MWFPGRSLFVRSQGGAQGWGRSANSLSVTLLATLCDTGGGRWVPVECCHGVLALHDTVTSPSHCKGTEEAAFFLHVKV